MTVAPPNPPARLRSRLIGLVAAILVVGFAATTFLSYRVSLNSIRTSVIENELPLTSDTIYSEIQRDLLRPVFIASLMANDTFLQDWITDGERNELAVRRYLLEIKNKYDVFTSFLIAEPSRRYYHFSGVSRVVREDREQDAWYFRGRAMDADYEINVDDNEEQGGSLTVFINHRVVDTSGRFLGITGVGLDVGTVAAIIDRYRDIFGRHVYFVDHDGRIKMRSEGAAIQAERLQDVPGLAGAVDAIVAADQSTFEYEANGENFLLTARGIPELQWTVLVEQQESALTDGLAESTTTNLAIGIVAIILTTVAIGFALNTYNARLELLATTDRLTGLANRAVLDSALELAIRRRARTQSDLCVLMVDVDHFKSINDRFGHLKGDTILQTVATTIQGAVRDSDLVCRWGGEEFCVLAQDCSLDDGQRIADKIRTAIADSVVVGDPPTASVTVSVGIADARDDETAETVVKRADAALYAAKDAGRDRVMVADVAAA